MAIAIYTVCVAVWMAAAGPHRIAEHSPYNHYALLADAWLHGTHELVRGAPGYAQNNDFAVFEGKTYISFPPFPAILMLPFVKWAGTPERFFDGQFSIWIAGIGPSALFLVLEKLRRTGRLARSEKENFILALLLAFGTVFFFTAVQGTVWFTAHVVGGAALALYLLFSLNAERPFWAGLALAGAWTSRPIMLVAGLLFVAEALREHATVRVDEESFLRGLNSQLRSLRWRPFARSVVTFMVPVLASIALASWYNYTRFRNPSPYAFGHEHLTVAWHGRILKWGLLSYHYLPKNLGIALTMLPWLPPRVGAETFGALFKINEHGLALWFTTPFYLWVLWPKRTSPLTVWIALTTGLLALLLLGYQNSGWRQFGYRFSNDYALLLFMLLALTERPMGWFFRTAAAWSVAWNLFGAVSFDRTGFDKYYFSDGSQSILYQPD